MPVIWVKVNYKAVPVIDVTTVFLFLMFCNYLHMIHGILSRTKTASFVLSKGFSFRHPHEIHNKNTHMHIYRKMYFTPPANQQGRYEIKY
jgi:hypothetical protein